MAFLKFTDALMEAKRRARLQGREVSQQEATGVSEGIAAAAGERAIQAEQLATQKEQFNKTFGLEREKWQAQYDILKKNLDMEIMKFDEMVRQYNESSRTQREQFGQQMEAQLLDTNARIKNMQDQVDLTKGAGASAAITNGQPVPSWTMPDDWNGQRYIELNPDVGRYYSAATAGRHWHLYGKQEGRAYK